MKANEKKDKLINSEETSMGPTEDIKEILNSFAKIVALAIESLGWILNGIIFKPI